MEPTSFTAEDDLIDAQYPVGEANNVTPNGSPIYTNSRSCSKRFVGLPKLAHAKHSRSYSTSIAIAPPDFSATNLTLVLCT